MKYKAIATPMAVVMALGIIFSSITALATESTSQEAVKIEEDSSEETGGVVAESEYAETNETECTEEVGDAPIQNQTDSDEYAPTEEADKDKDVNGDEEPSVGGTASVEKLADIADTSEEVSEVRENELTSDEDAAETEIKEAALAVADDTVASGICGDNITWTLSGTDDNLTLTIKGRGQMNSFTKTSTPWGSKRNRVQKIIVSNGITSIGEYAFYSMNRLTEVSLPGTVTSLEWGCFSRCNSLVNITIPYGVQEIGIDAFSECKSLRSIIIPESVRFLQGNAFSECSNLAEVEIRSGVKSIGDFAFSNCRSLKELVLPEGVNSIEEHAFSGCSNLESIIIPDSITRIGYDAFSECSSLKSVMIPNGVTSIEEGTFSDCTSLATVEISDSVERIEGYAFSGCNALKNISIPEGVYIIGTCAFSECCSLTGIILPGSLNSIEDQAFEGCSGLVSIKIPNSVDVIRSGAFCECSSLRNIVIPDGVLYIEDYTFSYCTNLTTVSLPAGISGIGECAFSGCKRLKSIMIPATVTSIGDYAFDDSVTEILFSGTRSQWNSAVGDSDIDYKSIVFNYFSVDAVFKLSGTAFNYTGNPIKPVVTVTYKGKKLVEGKNYKLVYKNNINAGKATVNINGIGNYSGTAIKTFTIRKLVNTITAKNVAKSYSAQVQTFDLGVKVKNGTPTYKSDNSAVTVSKAGRVTIKAAFIGNATITIKSPASTNYTMVTKSIVVKVVPTKTKFTSVTNITSKKMKLAWVKRTNATGYVIQYSTSSTFASAKTVRIDRNTIVSTTIDNLVKGKKYYVRIKTFKTVSGTKYYSGWSDAMSLVIKK